jgi:hypothetical protein
MLPGPARNKERRRASDYTSSLLTNGHLVVCLLWKWNKKTKATQAVKMCWSYGHACTSLHPCRSHPGQALRFEYQPQQRRVLFSRLQESDLPKRLNDILSDAAWIARQDCMSFVARMCQLFPSEAAVLLQIKTIIVWKCNFLPRWLCIVNEGIVTWDVEVGLLMQRALGTAWSLGANFWL